MSKIFCLFGASCSGKDTAVNNIISTEKYDLTRLVYHTTRPIRENEKNGETYFFDTGDDYINNKVNKNIVEERVYDTEYGKWRYYTLLEDIDMDNDYIVPCSYEQYNMIKTFFKCNLLYMTRVNVIGIYMDCSPYCRLKRCMNRVKDHNDSKAYMEICRRFLDEENIYTDSLIFTSDHYVNTSEGPSRTLNILVKILDKYF